VRWDLVQGTKFFDIGLEHPLYTSDTVLAGHVTAHVDETYVI
jgi:hypothetical protein